MRRRFLQLKCPLYVRLLMARNAAKPGGSP